MKVVSAEQMHTLDRHVIEDIGIPALILMERAGVAVADGALRLHYQSPGNIIILCGKGNNGGDGLVAARLLHESGYQVITVLPFVPTSLSAEASEMYDRAVAVGATVQPTISDTELQEAGVVIDALLGTGVTGAVTGVMGELITRTNAARGGRGVLAVDLPSGVQTDTGEILGPAIRAELTVTMALPKPCLVLYPGLQQAGQWYVADIGFPREIMEIQEGVGNVTEQQDAQSWLPYRPPTAHKHSVGWVLIVAGSFGMTGAAAMASTAAYRSGAGLVRLALPASLIATLNAALPEVVFLPMPEIRAGALGFQAVKQLLAEAGTVQAALIGPGLSHQAATQHAIRHFVANWAGPLVIDADALTALAGHDEVFTTRSAPTIITPHPGEMSRLLGTPVHELERDRLQTAKLAAQRFNAITVFKGTPTIIADPHGNCYINPTGNAGLAKAGTGDTLAGSIVAFLAQQVSPLYAATLATYVGGLAAELVAEEIDLRGMTALDLSEAIPIAMKRLTEA